jgi:ABC-type antimicrobial peptide transport system permease subunit
MDGDLHLLTIVGIVGDVHDQSLDTPVHPTIYPYSGQRPQRSSSITIVMRGIFDKAGIVAAARSKVRELSTDVPVRFRTVEDVVSALLSERRFSLLLLGVFGLSALVLAAIGIYGVIAYSVALRTHEIGIRMALGANPAGVRRLVVGQGMAIILRGVGLGLLGAFWLTRLLSSLLYGVSIGDPVTYVGVVPVMIVVTVAACYFPARRASRVDPMIAPRNE